MFTGGRGNEAHAVLNWQNNPQAKAGCGLCTGGGQPEPCQLPACPTPAPLSTISVVPTVGQWGPCSATCGTQGFQTRQHQCVRFVNGFQQLIPQAQWASTAACANLATQPVRQPCNLQSCPVCMCQMQFGQCSVTCGNGTMTRQITCLKGSR